jgi:hypothetical protein
MQMRPVLMVALLIGLSIEVAHAQPHDGNELLQECNAAIVEVDHSDVAKPSDALSVGLCFGMVRGVMETMLVWQIADNAHKQEPFWGSCIPADVSPTQAVRIVVKYLNDHPEELNRGDSTLVMSALSKAFPCKKA